MDSSSCAFLDVVAQENRNSSVLSANTSSLRKECKWCESLHRRVLLLPKLMGWRFIHFWANNATLGNHETIKPGDSKLEREWHHVEYLLIDEMSMVGLTLLAKAQPNHLCCKACRSSGSISVVWMSFSFGDYLQYRPVYDVATAHWFFITFQKEIE